MKEKFGSLRMFVGIVLFTVVLFIALQLRPVTNSVTNVNSLPSSVKTTTQAYPLPQLNTPSIQLKTSNNGYPVPGETINSVRNIDCSKAGIWVEYINKKLDFSFVYPAEAEIFESVDSNGYTSITMFLKPYCYVSNWWGPKQVDIVVLNNTEKLPLNDFILKQHQSDISTDSLVLSQELANSSNIVIVDQISSMSVNGKITRETPHIYIPYNDTVIFIGLTETSNMPPFEPACPTTLNIFNKFLATVKFKNH